MTHPIPSLTTQLSHTSLDYAEIQARLPKPPGRPRKALRLQRG